MIIQPRKFKAIMSAALMVISTACGAQNSSPTAAQREAAVQAQLAAERPIAAGSSYWLEELTSLEIRDLIASGTTTVIISTGGIEENGPYLATGKHNLILEGVCPALAEKLGNALCAPLVKFVPEGNINPPTGSMRYPGTISLSASTYEALLTDIASSLKQSGFTDIVMIGDSGGNQSGMANVADALGADWTDDETRIHFVRAFYEPGWVATEDYTQRELGVAESSNDGYHDDIWVTAMMMVTDPEQVRFSQRVNAGLASINGVAITPLEDTIELGRKMIEFRAEYTARAIQKVVASKN
jgi:creatinine amidohydrolase